MQALLVGCFKALGPGEAWPPFFDLSPRGLKQSFAALGLSMGSLYVIARGGEQERQRLMDSLANASESVEATTITPIALLPFIIVTVLYGLSFILSAYILSLMFDRQDRFRAWVIVRHWSAFFAVLNVAIFFILYMYFGLPFAVANFVAFVTYLGLLVIDIRLAQKIAGFDWGGAVLSGCLIHALGLCVLLTSLSQLSG